MYYISTICSMRRTIISDLCRQKQYVFFFFFFKRQLKPKKLQPYFQPFPLPPNPFNTNATLGDPTISPSTPAAWALNIRSSSNIIIFGEYIFDLI